MATRDDPWQKLHDGKSKRDFYHNRVTGERSWHKPKLRKPPSLDDDDEVNVLDEVDNPLFASPSPQPAVKTRAYLKDSSAASVTTAPAPRQDSGKHHEPTSTHWKAHHDPASSRVYYVSNLPCDIGREGGKSLVIKGSSLVILEGKACYPV